MNRGTHSGDLAEIDFVKRFNSEKNNQDFDFYIKDLDIKEVYNTTHSKARMPKGKPLSCILAFLFF